VSKEEHFDGGVFLSEIEHKDTVSGGLTGVKTYPKYEQAMAALVSHFQDAKAAEELKPDLQGFCEGCCAGIADVVACAGIADVVASKVEHFDGGVILSEIEQKDMVSGANRGRNACRYRVMGHYYLVPDLENYAQYTCLRIAEAFVHKVEHPDRWVVGLELGYWNATELLQRLALLLSNT